MVRLNGRTVCSKKVVENFWNVPIFSSVTAEGRVAGMVVGNDEFVSCTGDMIFQTSIGFSQVRKVANFFWAGPFEDYVLF